MLSKSREKFIRSLHLSKNRKKEMAFFLEGTKMALDAFAEASIEILSVYATENWIDNHASAVAQLSEVIPISARSMKKISALQTPTEVLVVIKMLPICKEYQYDHSGLAAIYLDGIQNPGNMGTIIRIADWFGVPQIIASSTCVDFFNPKVIQSSMSSIFRIKLSIEDINLLAQKMKGAQFWATDMDGTPIQKMNTSQNPIILMIGNEGKGLSLLARQQASETVTIPGHPDSKTESLNAAIATGILCSYF